MKVVAAVIKRDGRVLICQRKTGRRHGGKWEFPGGKVEPGEDLKSALKRELLEELGISAVIGDRIEGYDYAYPGRSPIQLVFYKVSEFQGEPANLIFEQIRWERAARLPEYDFLEGDVDFVRRLARLES
jgi:8-oxo-dGTP diphosphatase